MDGKILVRMCKMWKMEIGETLSVKELIGWWIVEKDKVLYDATDASGRDRDGVRD